MSADPAVPFARRAIDIVVPATARWLVARMALLEEYELNATERWESLKRTLEQLGRENTE